MKIRVKTAVLFMLFALLQYYFLVYEGILETGDGTVSRLVYANYDQIQYMLFFMAIFLFLFLFVRRIPVLRPEYRVRFANQLPAYVIRRSILEGSVLAALFYGIIVGLSFAYGLRFGDISYLVMSMSRLVIYYIASFLSYWALYFITAKEVVSMISFLLVQWFLVIIYVLIDFYVFGIFKPTHNLQMGAFMAFEVFIGAIAVFLIYKFQHKEHVLK